MVGGGSAALTGRIRGDDPSSRGRRSPPGAPASSSDHPQFHQGDGKTPFELAVDQKFRGQLRLVSEPSAVSISDPGSVRSDSRLRLASKRSSERRRGNPQSPAPGGRTNTRLRPIVGLGLTSVRAGSEGTFHCGPREVCRVTDSWNQAALRGTGGHERLVTQVQEGQKRSLEDTEGHAI